MVRQLPRIFGLVRYGLRKKVRHISVKRERAYSALSEVASQEMCSVLVGELPDLCRELDHVAAALAVAETPITVQRRRHDEAAVGCVRADRTRASQLSACLLQVDA